MSDQAPEPAVPCTRAVTVVDVDDDGNVVKERITVDGDHWPAWFLRSTDDVDHPVRTTHSRLAAVAARTGQVRVSAPGAPLVALLGTGYLKPAARKRAFETNSDYKNVVLEELGARAWSRDVIDVAAGTATLAGAAPLLGVNLINDEQWWTWVREQPIPNPFVRPWLMSPPDITGGYLDARHRITYLRFMCGPAFSVLVRYQR